MILLIALFTMTLMGAAYATAGETVAIEPSAKAASKGSTAKVSLPKGVVARTDVPDATDPIIEVDKEQVRLLVRYKASDNKTYKVKVAFGKYETYYDLYAINADEYFPLSYGNGNYNVTIFRVTDPQKGTAQVVKNVSVKLNAKDKNAAFLSSHTRVAWEYANNTLKQADNLTKKASKGSSSTVDAVYNYIIKNVKYDYDKLEKGVSGSYIPDIDTVLKAKKGICQDYATLAAAMLRYEGVPTRMVFGYADTVGGAFHAWNEIYVDGKWVPVDMTYDATYVQKGHSVKMAKSAGQFKMTSLY